MCIFMHFGIISKLNLQCNLYSIFFFRKTSFFLTSPFELLRLLHSYCNGAPDWAYRLNSYQASNWLYGFHPRVSNSHWLLSPNAVVIKSARFSWFVKKWIFCKKVNCYKSRCNGICAKMWKWHVGASNGLPCLENAIRTGFVQGMWGANENCPKFTYKWISGSCASC